MHLQVKRIMLALVPVLAAAAHVPEYTADGTAHASTVRSETQNSRVVDERASMIIGAEVYDGRGETLGKIRDLIVDVNNARVRYAVLSLPGIDGMKDELFACPLGALQRVGDSDRLLLEVARPKLAGAPGFPSARWPNWNDNGYRREVDRYYAEGVPPRPMFNERLVRVSALLRADVAHPDRHDIGDMQDLVLRLPDGRLRYAVLSLDYPWGPKGKLVVVPMKALRVGIDVSRVILPVDRRTIRKAPTFAANDWPDLNAPAYRDRVDVYIASLPDRL